MSKIKLKNQEVAQLDKVVTNNNSETNENSSVSSQSNLKLFNNNNAEAVFRVPDQAERTAEKTVTTRPGIIDLEETGPVEVTVDFVVGADNVKSEERSELLQSYLAQENAEELALGELIDLRKEITLKSQKS